MPKSKIDNSIFLSEIKDNFTKIPNEIIETDKLTGNEKNVLNYLIRTKYSFNFSIKRACKKLGLTERTGTTIFNSLIKKGYILKKKSKGLITYVLPNQEHEKYQNEKLIDYETFAQKYPTLEEQQNYLDEERKRIMQLSKELQKRKTIARQKAKEEKEFNEALGVVEEATPTIKSFFINDD